MEQRSLKAIGADRTFFGKLTNTITRLLIPTQIGFNSVMILIKRNSVLKTFENYIESNEKEQVERRYEESYTLYLESIDKFVMDSIYKKVKGGSATDFEKDVLSKYYTVTALKEGEYLEYKYRKQKYLLELDYETLLISAKNKQMQRYNKFYVNKMDSLYKGLLKNYSVKLADKIASKYQSVEETYSKIFETLEEYITEVLPIKIEIGDDEINKKVFDDYDNFERFSAGKFDEKDYVEKNMVLLGISRSLFTHSLPLVAAEQCYEKLLKDIREIIANSKNATKRKEAFDLLLTLIEEYNTKLLSTKVYWEDVCEREEYKKFWNEYTQLAKMPEENRAKTKEILFIKRDLTTLDRSETYYNTIKKIYKDKLTEYGVLRKLKNTCRTSRNLKNERCITSLKSILKEGFYNNFI